MTIYRQFIRKISVLSAVLTVIMTLGSCDDSFAGSDLASTEVTIEIIRPDDVVSAVTGSQKITFRNVSSGVNSEYASLSGISLIPGLYDIAYEATLTLASGAESTLRAAATSVQITGGSVTLKLEGYNNIETDDLIIAEIFFTGTARATGENYTGDDYIKLYNNTDHIIYADGITIFESKFLTTQKYEHTPDIMAEAMNVEALYTVPGSGREHPVAPGEYFLICDTGIDHRSANPNSFDLSGADFEWYDVSTKPAHVDIDSPTVPNLDKLYCYTLSYWLLHNRGYKAFGIARIPVSGETYLKDYKYRYDYTLVTVAGSFPMQGEGYRLPNEWIVDVVNCSMESLYAWNLCAPALDSGWTGCGEYDKDPGRFFHSVRRKMLRLNEQGNPVLKDTNNSSADFNANVIASEIEIQGTAMAIDGTPCNQLTYDGVTPRSAK